MSWLWETSRLWRVLGINNPDQGIQPSGTKVDVWGLLFEANRAGYLRRSWSVVLVILGFPQLEDIWLQEGPHFDIMAPTLCARVRWRRRRPRTRVGQRLEPTNEDGKLLPRENPTTGTGLPGRLCKWSLYHCMSSELAEKPRLQLAIARSHFHEAAFWPPRHRQHADLVLYKDEADSCPQPAKGQPHRAGWASLLTRAATAFNVKGGFHAVHPSSLGAYSLKSSWEQK